jgi:DNA/RNA endonuclease YhcR with UshA esterase domain
MKRIIVRLSAAASVACVLTLLGVSPARAHHAFEAEYDANKPVTLTGFVTKLEWVNPHAYVSIDTKDENGTVKTFKVEMGPPYALVRGGWKRDTIKIGDKVTVEGAGLAKNGSDAAGAMPTTMMVLANGQRLPMR